MRKTNKAEHERYNGDDRKASNDRIDHGDDSGRSRNSKRDRSSSGSEQWRSGSSGPNTFDAHRDH